MSIIAYDSIILDELYFLNEVVKTIFDTDICKNVEYSSRCNCLVADKQDLVADDFVSPTS